MIKVNEMTVEVEGKNSDLLVECTLALTSVADTIADGDSNFAGATLYAVFMGAAKILRERHNIDVDTSFIGTEIAKATKE